MPNSFLQRIDVSNEIDNQLLASGFDTNADPVLSALMSPLKDAMGDVIDQQISQYNRAVLALCSERDLDEKAMEFGVRRGSIGVPFDDTFTNFYVYLTKDKAKDFTLNTDEPLVIPPRALTITDINNSEFFVQTAIVIEPESSTGFAPIIGTSAGSISVGANSLTKIKVDLTLIQNANPTKVQGLTFGCNNKKVIGVPNPIVSDQDLRDAAFLRINSMNNTNRDAIRLALNRVGISDIRFKQDMFGVGTLGVVVRIGNSSKISSTTIRAINNILTNIVPFARVVEPETLLVKLSVRIGYKASADIISTKTQVMTTIQGYFRELDIGNYLDPMEIENRVNNIETVEDFKINCVFIDDRPCIKSRQPAMEDQIYMLDANEPITYLT